MEEQVWTPASLYYATNRPGKYITKRQGRELLFYGMYPTGGHPTNEFFSAFYFFGTYYLRHTFTDRTAGGDSYCPFPSEVLDHENSVSMGDLAAWCLNSESFSAPIGDGPDSAEFYRSKGWMADAQRCWQPDDRIRLLQPLVKTRFIISERGYFHHFYSRDERHELGMPDEQFREDSLKGIVPDVLYAEKFGRE